MRHPLSVDLYVADFLREPHHGDLRKGSLLSSGQRVAPPARHHSIVVPPIFETTSLRNGLIRLVAVFFWLLFHLGRAFHLEVEGYLQVAWSPPASRLFELAFEPVP